jgi:dTDP-4-amino-4,6-dideoxygalactose transaminase
VDKYTWVDIGGSHLPSELTCAFLLGQLEQMDAIQDRRREIFEFYRLQLASLEQVGVMRLPFIPEGCQTNYHMFFMLATDGATRDAILDHLKAQGIGAVFHYVPLHSSPMGQRFGYCPGQLPVTEDLSARLLRLPIYVDLSPDDQSRIVRAIERFYTSPLGSRATDPIAETAI